MNLPSCSTGVSLIRLGGIGGGGRGPTTALVTGPMTWAKAIVQTIAIPEITPEITKSFDLTLRIVFNSLSANRDFARRIAVRQKHATRLILPGYVWRRIRSLFVIGN